MFRLFTLLILSVTAMPWTASQMIIPKTPFGFVYNNGSNDAPINLNIHMCLLCGDSRHVAPMLKEVANVYGASVLKMTFHIFPLPYHQQAFLTAVGAYAVTSLQSVDSAYKWFDTIYSHMESLSDSATENMTHHDVISVLAGYADECCAIKDQDFVEAMALKPLKTKAKAAWKYSCSRTVASTPTYFLNDVQLAADPSWTLEDWKHVIDQLLVNDDNNNDVNTNDKNNNDANTGNKNNNDVNTGDKNNNDVNTDDKNSNDVNTGDKNNNDVNTDDKNNNDVKFFYEDVEDFPFGYDVEEFKFHELDFEDIDYPDEDESTY